MADHVWMERLHKVAAGYSMQVEQHKAFRRLVATRVGPGWPRALETQASRDTPGGWNSAAKRLHDAIVAEQHAEATAANVPDTLPDDWEPTA